MVSLRSLFNRLVVFSAIASFVCLPLAVSGAALADSACTPPAAGPGVHQPTGADAGTYTYNCNDGLWENQYYSYDPATGLTSATYSITYTCNPDTGLYTYTNYVFDAASGGYDPVTQAVSHVPAGATVVPCPAPTTAASPTTSSPSASNDPSSINNTLNNDQTLNNQTNATVNNNLSSSSTSGNTLVNGNTTAGNAGSGAATVVANEMNLVQSAANFGTNGQQPITFVSNINGDVNGDFLLDPASLSVVQPAASTSNTDINNNLTVNNTTNATLNNNLDLTAQSGDAGVTNNTTAGNATTGNATAVANLVNMINSAITSGKSFLGVVNINGNLNGDILLPANFVDQLIADNVPTVTVTVPAGPNTTNTVNNSSTTNNNTNEAIDNNVTASAVSGVATVAGNTNGGSATSGNATTHVTAFNLTGSSLIGNNDLLVFVNVLGKWVGLIVNAPPGATAAELGGGITNNTTANNSSTLNNNTNEQINNNVNVKAGSGDATVQHNTTGGNATTGNADAAVNLLNVENSSLSLANWFGILFINVFGTWNGSFGINTSAGDPVPTADSATGGVSSPTFTIPAVRFVPSSLHAGGSGGSGAPQLVFSNFGGTDASSTDSGSNTPQNAVLASHVAKQIQQPAAPIIGGGHINWWVALSGLSVCGIYLLGARLNAWRHSH